MTVKENSNETMEVVKEIHEEYWQIFSEDMECDFYIYSKGNVKNDKRTRKEIKKWVEIMHIGKETSTNYIKHDSNKAAQNIAQKYTK